MSELDPSFDPNVDPALAEERAHRRRLARSTAVFGAATGLSRVLGLVREIIAAYTFGAAGKINAFTVAFQIPNLVRSLVADTALSGAFVPVFSELLEKGERARAWRVASTIFWLVLLITTCPDRDLRAHRPVDRRAVRDAGRGLRPRRRALATPLPDRDPARALGDHRRDPQRLRPVHGPGADAGRVEPGDHPRARARRSRRRKPGRPALRLRGLHRARDARPAPDARARGFAGSTAGCGSRSTGAILRCGGSSSSCSP